MKESNTQKELSRVPRTLSESSNTKVLEVLFDAGGTVMSDIIIYVASSQMKDLFGDCWFSINDFCEVMGYERTKLQRKLTEKQLDFLFSNQRPDVPPVHHTDILCAYVWSTRKTEQSDPLHTRFLSSSYPPRTCFAIFILL